MPPPSSREQSGRQHLYKGLRGTCRRGGFFTVRLCGAGNDGRCASCVAASLDPRAGGARRRLPAMRFGQPMHFTGLNSFSREPTFGEFKEDDGLRLVGFQEDRCMDVNPD